MEYQIKKNASNQSGGSFVMNSNGIYSTTTRIRKVTSIVREFDEDGKLVKETETITEYEKVAEPYYPYQPYQPSYPLVTYSS